MPQKLEGLTYTNVVIVSNREARTEIVTMFKEGSYRVSNLFPAMYSIYPQ